MSYDLYFTSPRISEAEFVRYFSGRPGYEVSTQQAWYNNEETGVYFTFDHNSEPPEDEDDVEHSVAFNLNYFRPHYFALEAEPEVRAFLTHFGCGIHDDQNAGMGQGPYTREGFFWGWNSGNEFAYHAMLSKGDAFDSVHARPTEELERIWEWNLHRNKRQEAVAEDIFIPQIMFFEVNGVVRTGCVWPDAIPIVIPKVDVLYILRNELAPKRWLRRTREDFCIAAVAQLPGFFQRFAKDEYGWEVIRLPAPSTPTGVHEFVRGLAPFKGTINRIGYDDVLNAELVSKYRGNGGGSRPPV